MNIEVTVADKQHFTYTRAICELIEEAAKARGTGIAKRKPEYVLTKMQEGKAIIALADTQLAGFCYIESWDHSRYVANSGLIVASEFRQMGLAKRIKEKAFELSREKFPKAKLFGITTSLPVMRINSGLGYKPVTFSELTQDEVFWAGCKSCPNYEVLSRNDRKLCLCTGMLYDPAKEAKTTELRSPQQERPKSRWQLFKEHLARRQSNPILQRIKDNLFNKVSKKELVKH